jgi:putative transcriptional regulator
MSSPPAGLSTPILLMAMPQVLDPYFHKSVVLLIHHEENGSLGFVVNRPTELKVSSILEGLNVEWRGKGEAVAFLGGPVQRQLGTVLFDAGAAAGDDAGGVTEVAPGIALTQHVSDLSRLAEAPPERFRLLLGYAGWGEGQLIDEVLRNDWLTAPVRSDLIFSTEPDLVWDEALRSVGVNPATLPSWTPGSTDEEAN